jgi:hypothetical protein
MSKTIKRARHLGFISYKGREVTINSPFLRDVYVTEFGEEEGTDPMDLVDLRKPSQEDIDALEAAEKQEEKAKSGEKITS